jgi:hypothetical protein
MIEFLSSADESAVPSAFALTVRYRSDNIDDDQHQTMIMIVINKSQERPWIDPIVPVERLSCV